VTAEIDKAWVPGRRDKGTQIERDIIAPQPT
jgi:hypothetical protein